MSYKVRAASYALESDTQRNVWSKKSHMYELVRVDMHLFWNITPNVVQFVIFFIFSYAFWFSHIKYKKIIVIE